MGITVVPLGVRRNLGGLSRFQIIKITRFRCVVDDTGLITGPPWISKPGGFFILIGNGFEIGNDSLPYRNLQVQNSTGTFRLNPF